MPPEVKTILLGLARDSYELRELWWYTIVLGMMDRECAWLHHSRCEGGRNWLWFRTIEGQEFPLPDPGISPQTEQALRRAARLLTGEHKDDTAFGEQSVWGEVLETRTVYPPAQPLRALCKN